MATEVGLSLREQERLAARGLAGVSGWWDSDAVLLAAAPTVYGGRDVTPLPAQLLTGRYALPSPDEIRAEMDAEREAHAKRFYRSKRHTMEVDFDEWLDGARKERARGAERAAARGYAPPVVSSARESTSVWR